MVRCCDDADCEGVSGGGGGGHPCYGVEVCRCDGSIGGTAATRWLMMRTMQLTGHTP